MADLTDDGQWFRYWMPYQFVKMESRSHKHVYLPVNRNYNPLGVWQRGHVDHEQYRSQCVVFARDPHEITGVWSEPVHLYLYDDDPASRSDYFERLGRLLNRSVELFDPKADEDQSPGVPLILRSRYQD